MQLQSLTLQNFKSFSETPQTIYFKLITLLFGPNSSGKSSILTSLIYIHEILDKGNCNPSVISRLPDRNLGGFYNLVNGHDLNKSITLKLAFTVGGIGTEYDTYAEQLGDPIIVVSE